MNNIDNYNSSYTHDKIISIMNDTIGLYLVIKKDNENRAKLTIKTILMSINKNDIDTFNKYYKLFNDTLFKIKNEKILNDEEIHNRDVAFALLTQIKFIIDSYNNDDVLRDIIEKDFSNLDEQNFYLFEDTNNNFITNIHQIENIQEFKLFCKNIIIDCSEELLKNYF
jgi:hypothetical protein